MTTKPQAVRCGNCGCDTAKIHAIPMNDGAVGFARLTLTCTGCGETSIVQVQPARIEIEWGSEDNDGVFTAGWGDET